MSSIDKNEAARAIGTLLKDEFTGLAKVGFGLFKGHSYAMQAFEDLHETLYKNLDRVKAAFTPKPPQR